MKNLRNITKIAVALAGVAMVVGCAKSIEEPVVDITVNDPVVVAPTTKTMTIRAGKPATGGDTRTVLDGTKVNWHEDDKLGLSILAYAEGEEGSIYEREDNLEFSIPYEGIDPITDIATFEGNFPNVDFSPAGVFYFAYTPYSEDAVVSSDDGTASGIPTKVTLTLPMQQTPTATSFDPAADFLFGMAMTVDAEVGKAQDGSEGIVFDFQRPFAVGKFGFSNEVSVPSGTGTVDVSEQIVEYVQMNFKTKSPSSASGEFTAEALVSGEYSVNITRGNNTIVLDYSGQNIKLEDLTAYWVMNPVTVEVGDQIDLMIQAGDYFINKTIEPDKSLEFKANHLNSGTVNLSTGDATAIFVDLLEINPFTGEGAYIPDANFLAYCSNQMGTDGNGWDKNVDGKLTLPEAAAVKNLYLTDKGIEDLTGIEWFSGLQLLQCDKNKLTSLDLSQNMALSELYATENQLISITLPDSDKLNTISLGGWLSRNKLASIDVSQLPNLLHLEISNNEIETIDVTNNPELVELALMGNLISEIDLSKNQELQGLQISYNKLTSLDISNNYKLDFLECEYNSGVEGKFRVKMWPGYGTIPAQFTAADAYWGYLINEDDEDETTIYIEYYE
jgi:hypothetical protein